MVVSIQEALVSGLKRYFTGKPCKKGHVAERQVSDSYCVVCAKAQKDSYRRKNREAARTATNAWSKTDIGKLKQEISSLHRKLSDQKRVTKLNTEKSRRYLKLPTPTRAEPEVCEICGNRPDVFHLCVDHCHKTGKFRGWLCRSCNLGLGNLKDSTELLEKAAKYLRITDVELSKW